MSRYQEKASTLLRSIPTRRYALASILLITVFALMLLAMGQTPWCECGYVKLWHGVTMSSENSQHISDWYTPSHVIHGFAFYALLWFFGRRLPIAFRLLAAIFIEVSWEIFENTDFVINRYRETTISLDYYGDSVLNSISDVLAMILGFALAWRLPVWVIVVATVLMELFVGYAIRDNLALNIVMLIHPFDAIIKWQQGGG